MNKKLFAGIIDLKINNLFSIYKSCLKAGYKVEIVDPKKKHGNKITKEITKEGS